VRLLNVAGPRADRARNPVERSQPIDDRAANTGDRKGLKLDLALRLVALDCPIKPSNP
jgi:hypothetical protein